MDGEGALEELGAVLLLIGSRVGIKLFVKEFPHFVREIHQFEVFGVLESVLEFAGNCSVVFWFCHDFADHALLAVKIVVVDVLVHVLEYLDPLEDVDSFPWGIVVGSVLSVLPFILTVLVSISLISVIVSVISRSSEDTSSIDKVEDNTQQDKSSQ